MRLFSSSPCLSGRRGATPPAGLLDPEDRLPLVLHAPGHVHRRRLVVDDDLEHLADAIFSIASLERTNVNGQTCPLMSSVRSTLKSSSVRAAITRSPRVGNFASGAPRLPAQPGSGPARGRKKRHRAAGTARLSRAPGRSGPRICRRLQSPRGPAVPGPRRPDRQSAPAGVGDQQLQQHARTRTDFVPALKPQPIRAQVLDVGVDKAPSRRKGITSIARRKPTGVRESDGLLYWRSWLDLLAT